MDIFLSNLYLTDYIPIFNKHQIEFKDLLLFNEEDLEKMGITVLGIKLKLLEAIKEVHKRSWDKTSLSSLKQKELIR